MACYEGFEDVVVYAMRSVEDGESTIDSWGGYRFAGARRSGWCEGEIEIFVVVVV